MNFEDLHRVLKSYSPEKILFIGLGNELRADVAAGLLFIDNLKQKAEYSTSSFLKAGTNPENYLQQIVASKAELIVFFDAARFGGKPGEIRWLNKPELDSVKISTHSYSIDLIEKYILEFRPVEFKYVIIEPLTTTLGKTLSNSVALAIENFFA